MFPGPRQQNTSAVSRGSNTRSRERKRSSDARDVSLASPMPTKRMRVSPSVITSKRGDPIIISDDESGQEGSNRARDSGGSNIANGPASFIIHTSGHDHESDEGDVGYSSDGASSYRTARSASITVVEPPAPRDEHTNSNAGELRKDGVPCLGIPLPVLEDESSDEESGVDNRYRSAVDDNPDILAQTSPVLAFDFAFHRAQPQPKPLLNVEDVTMLQSQAEPPIDLNVDHTQNTLGLVIGSPATSRPAPRPPIHIEPIRLEPQLDSRPPSEDREKRSISPLIRPATPPPPPEGFQDDDNKGDSPNSIPRSVWPEPVNAPPFAAEAEHKPKACIEMPLPKLIRPPTPPVNAAPVFRRWDPTRDKPWSATAPETVPSFHSTSASKDTKAEDGRNIQFPLPPRSQRGSGKSLLNRLSSVGTGSTLSTSNADLEPVVPPTPTPAKASLIERLQEPRPSLAERLSGTVAGSSHPHPSQPSPPSPPINTFPLVTTSALPQRSSSSSSSFDGESLSQKQKRVEEDEPSLNEQVLLGVACHLFNLLRHELEMTYSRCMRNAVVELSEDIPHQLRRHLTSLVKLLDGKVCVGSISRSAPSSTVVESKWRYLVFMTKAQAQERSNTDIESGRLESAGSRVVHLIQFTGILIQRRKEEARSNATRSITEKEGSASLQVFSEPAQPSKSTQRSSSVIGSRSSSSMYEVDGWVYGQAQHENIVSGSSAMISDPTYPTCISTAYPVDDAVAAGTWPSLLNSTSTATPTEGRVTSAFDPAPWKELTEKFGQAAASIRSFQRRARIEREGNDTWAPSQR